MNWFQIVLTVVIVENALAETTGKPVLGHKIEPIHKENKLDESTRLKKQNSSSDTIEMHTYARLIIPKNAAGILMLNNMPIFSKNCENLTTTASDLKVVDNHLENTSQQQQQHPKPLRNVAEVSAEVDEQTPPSLQSTTSKLSNVIDYLQHYTKSMPVPPTRPTPSQQYSSGYQHYPAYYYDNMYKSRPYWFKPTNEGRPSKPNLLELLAEDSLSKEETPDSDLIESDAVNADIDDSNQYTTQYNEANSNQFDDFYLYGRNNLKRKSSSFDSPNPYGFAKYISPAMNRDFSIYPSATASSSSSARMQPNQLASFKLNPFIENNNKRYSTYVPRQYQWQYLNTSPPSTAPIQSSFYGNSIPSDGFLNHRFYEQPTPHDGRGDSSNYFQSYAQQAPMTVNQRGESPLVSELKNSLRQLKTNIAKLKQAMLKKMQTQADL